MSKTQGYSLHLFTYRGVRVERTFFKDLNCEFFRVLNYEEYFFCPIKKTFKTFDTEEQVKAKINYYLKQVKLQLICKQ